MRKGVAVLILLLSGNAFAQGLRADREYVTNFPFQYPTFSLPKNTPIRYVRTDPGNKILFQSPSHPERTFYLFEQHFRPRGTVNPHPQEYKQPPQNQTCSAVNLLSRMGPPGDQGLKPWCFAYATADLLAAKFQKRFSILDLTLKGAETSARNVSEIMSGSPLRTLRSAFQNGICLEEQLPIESGDNDYIALVKETEALQNHVLNHCPTGKCEPYLIGHPDSLAVMDRLQLSQIRDLADVLATETSRHAIERLAKKKCQPPYRVGVETENYYAKRESAMAAVQNELRQTPANPILINIQFNGLAKDPIEGANGHGMVVVGRRKTESGECQYLLRNTHGTRCDHIRPDLECVSEAGAIWVSESLLKNNLSEAFFIRP